LANSFEVEIYLEFLRESSRPDEQPIDARECSAQSRRKRAADCGLCKREIFGGDPSTIPCNAQT
jgi:hypothetical protein